MNTPGSSGSGRRPRTSSCSDVGQDTREDLETARRRAVEMAPDARPDARLVALGWATVDLERAAADLEADLGLPVGTFVEVSGSITLGAACRAAHGTLGSATTLVLLEPSREGRLAASLARFGEGVAAAWYVAGDGAGRAAGPFRSGPLGLEWLIPDAPSHGPFRFLVEREPGTIER